MTRGISSNGLPRLSPYIQLLRLSSEVKAGFKRNANVIHICIDCPFRTLLVLFVKLIH
jgi:hypothetical protein